MLITLIRIKNFQGIKNIEIIPRPGDRNWIYIGGKNEQGKSSLMGAIRAAFGGKNYKPDMPVREGEESASIYVELDNGKTILTKTFTEDGKTKLKLVDDEFGKVSSPQVMLDKIVGDRFLDPMEFMRLSSKDQREELLKLVDLDIDLDEHAKKRKGLFDARTDSNRDVKRLTAELGGLPGAVAELPTRMDMQKLIRYSDELQDSMAQAADARRAIEQCEGKVANKLAQAAQLEAQLRDARDALVEAESFAAGEKKRLGAIAEVDVTEELTAVREEMSDCDSHNSNVAKLEAGKAAHDSVSSKLLKAESQAKGFDAKIKALDKAKADALAKANMPVEGLDISDDAVLYNGVPLSQASSARKIRISLALASAAKPKLGDIQIENGSLLDEDSLAEVIKYATEHDLRVWLEMIGEAHDDCIVIEDGEVRDAKS